LGKRKKTTTPSSRSGDLVVITPQLDIIAKYITMTYLLLFPRDSESTEKLKAFVKRRVVDTLLLISDVDFYIFEAENFHKYKRLQHDERAHQLSFIYNTLRNGGDERFTFGALENISINHCTVPVFGKQNIGDICTLQVVVLASKYLNEDVPHSLPPLTFTHSYSLPLTYLR